jgi:choline dehydrogenase-like flavoprotein
MVHNFYQTAGLCLAARLSEDPAKSVLVVEAGEANLNDPAILRPASYGSHYDNNAYDWVRLCVFTLIYQRY